MQKTETKRKRGRKRKGSGDGRFALIQQVRWPAFGTAVRRAALCLVAAAAAGTALSMFANLFETLAGRI